MKSWLSACACICACTVAAATLWWAVPSASGQTKGDYTVPQVFGQPDLQGIWFTQSGAAAWDVEEHPAAAGIQAGPSIIVDPPDKKIPYQPWALAKRKDLTDHHAYDDPQAHCYASGVPRVSYAPFGLQIVQPPGYVVILYENFHLYRNIPLDSGSKLPSSMKLFMGDSHGHWDGDTLVVDVTNQNGRTWLDMASNFTSDTLHVVERYTRVADGTIAYEATLDDPAVYTRPWKMAFTMRRETRPDYQLLELACWEGERDLEHYTEDQGGAKKK